jgi:hypothetical protein
MLWSCGGLLSSIFQSLPDSRHYPPPYDSSPNHYHSSQSKPLGIVSLFETKPLTVFVKATVLIVTGHNNILRHSPSIHPRGTPSIDLRPHLPYNEFSHSVLHCRFPFVTSASIPLRTEPFGFSIVIFECAPAHDLSVNCRLLSVLRRIVSVYFYAKQQIG